MMTVRVMTQTMHSHICSWDQSDAVRDGITDRLTAVRADKVYRKVEPLRVGNEVADVREAAQPLSLSSFFRRRRKGSDCTYPAVAGPPTRSRGSTALIAAAELL